MRQLKEFAKSTSSNGLIFQLACWLTPQCSSLFKCFLQGDVLSATIHSENCHALLNMLQLPVSTCFLLTFNTLGNEKERGKLEDIQYLIDNGDFGWRGEKAGQKSKMQQNGKYLKLFKNRWLPRHSSSCVIALNTKHNKPFTFIWVLLSL